MQIESLRTELTGRVVAPQDEGWDAARLFHSGIGEPAVIVRAASVAMSRRRCAGRPPSRCDVDRARRRSQRVGRACPAGSRSTSPRCDDVEVDGTLVRVGGGATLGRGRARSLAEHGLGISSGDTASVGVGGLTLGGGIGWMVRAWGLAADQLEGAQLVTAAGDVVEVTGSSIPSCSGRSGAAAATSAW